MFISKKTIIITLVTVVMLSGCSEGAFDSLPTPPPVRQLNDTGQTWGANYPYDNNSDCSGNDSEAQDCSHGRDAQAAEGTLTKVGSGSAGFDFTKLDSNGYPLSVQEGTWSEFGDEGLGTKWSCVQDNHTGFIWEIKTTSGLHRSVDKYNWYNTDINTNGGEDGDADNNGAICDGYNESDPTTFCNTQAFVERVNIAGLCGNNDWRLPSIGVLRSIVDYSIFSPVIDTDTAYYPNVRSDYYWSSSAYANSSFHAWFVDFNNGDDSSYSRNNSSRVRLVRGGQ